MNEELLFGTPDGIDEEDLRNMQAAEDALESYQVFEPPEEEEEEPKSETPAEPAEPEAEEEKPEQPKDDGDGYHGTVNPNEQQPGEEGADFGDYARTYAENALAIPTGFIDFGTEVIDFVTPGLEVKKLPKFQNETIQTIRELASVIGPTIGLTMAGQGALAKATLAPRLARLAPLLNNPLTKKLAGPTIGAGASLAVGGVSEQYEGKNASQVLKETWPQTYSWIPNSIATLDNDSADTKRIKNITEDIGLGTLSDLVIGIGKIVGRSEGIKRSLNWVPETEKAKNWLRKNGPKVVDDAEEVVSASAAKRSDSLDELGAYDFSKSVDLDEPKLGVHDMFDWDESGIRSVDDMGIVGSVFDQYRISNNLDTSYGRLGSVVSTPAMKYMVQGADEYAEVFYGLREALDQSDQIGYRLKSGKMINNATVMSSAEDYARTLGYMTGPEIEEYVRKAGKGINPDTGAPMLDSELAAGIKYALRDAFRSFADPVVGSMVRTSFAGQVSDAAFAGRLSADTPAAQRAMDANLDRIKVLMVANGETGKQRALLLKLMDVFKRKGKKPTPAQLRKQGKDTIEQLQAEATEVVESLRGIAKERPQWLAPLMMAYEATNGNVKSMDHLNTYLINSYGVLNKAFLDGRPDIPSVYLRGFWANIYNSVLSAVGTPLKAAASAMVTNIQRPIASLVGAMIMGEREVIERTLYTYQGMWDGINKGKTYFAETLTRSGADVNYNGVQGRESLVRQNQDQLDVMKAAADAAAEDGNFGLQVFHKDIEAVNALANMAILRNGNRLMQAGDGYVQALIAHLSARNRAFQMYQRGSIDRDAIETVENVIYNKMWTKDKAGREIITDEAVREISGELNFNRDSDFTNGISSFIKHVPAVKPFLLFNKTPVEMTKFMASHNPVGLFMRESAQFGQNVDEVPITKMKELLQSRGVAFDPMTARDEYLNIQTEMLGRKAIGTLAVGSTVALFMNDRITGSGIYDRQKQRTRRDANWKPLSIKGLDGKYYSYDGLGAITDWIRLTVDIMDNLDVLHAGDIGEQLHAMMFVMSASFTDRTMLKGVEPIFDITNGNGSAINRWLSSFLPAASMPGTSLIAELSRIMSPGNRIVEENLASLITNRTPFKLSLEKEYNYITGGQIKDTDNFWVRLRNSSTPWKVGPELSPEEQFLIDVEYDSRPNTTSINGVELSVQEQSAVSRIMGEKKTFRDAIRQIMKSTDAEEFRRRYKEYKDKDGLRPDLKVFEDVHGQLDRALRLSVQEALDELNIDGDIDLRINEKLQEQNRQRTNNISDDIFVEPR